MLHYENVSHEDSEPSEWKIHDVNQDYASK